MKIKRVIAKDMRQGIQKVREELGEDAVILSNRRIDDGIEIVAGIDEESAREAPKKSAPEPIGVGEKQRSIFQDIVLDAAKEIASESEGNGLTYQRPGRKPAASEQVVETNNSDATTPRSVSYEDKADAAAKDIDFLTEMNNELKGLREILEQQVSGLAWGELGRSHPQRATLLKRLISLGLSSEVSQRLLEQMQEKGSLDESWRDILEAFSEQLKVTDDELIARGGVIAFVGPTGVGKTTTVAKLAARYALQHGYDQVALITTDSYRIGAHEQLRTYGRILGVPVRVANDAEELKTTLEGLKDRRLILIDTAGMSQRDVRLSEQFTATLAGAPNLKTCVVLSAHTQAAAIEDVLQRFSGVNLDACVLSKLDECVSLGGALSVIAKHELPIAYISDGQKVPEDIHVAHPQNLIQRSLKLMEEYGEESDELDMALVNGVIPHG